MALLNILKIPNPRLKIKAKPVEHVDDAIRSFLNDMVETMYANDGVGLAATQVGVDKRIIVIDAAADEESDRRELMKFINPEILWRSDDVEFMMEGCLSVPEQYGEVKRSLTLKIRYMNEYNEIIEREASGFLAHAFQHEIDHLNGVLFIDHLSSLKRQLILRKAAKSHKQPKL
ncbi:MAG: peptide deformylase [Janthinobacterium lividum]